MQVRGNRKIGIHHASFYFLDFLLTSEVRLWLYLQGLAWGLLLFSREETVSTHHAMFERWKATTFCQKMLVRYSNFIILNSFCYNLGDYQNNHLRKLQVGK